MTGVEFLNTETVYNTILPNIFVLIGFVATIVFGVLALKTSELDTPVVSLICGALMMCSVVVMILGDADNKNSIHYLEHQVTIDESVSLTEFLDKYEIIDQAGKIYTIKEKE